MCIYWIFKYKKGYKCYSLELKKIFIFKDETFHENIMYYSPAHDDNVNFLNKNSIESQVTNIPSSCEPCETLSKETIEINENDNVTQIIGENATADNLAQEQVCSEELSENITNNDQYVLNREGEETAENETEGDKSNTKGRQSSRVRMPKKLYPIEYYVNYNCFSQCSKVYVSNLINEKIPRTTEEALMDNQ